MKTTHHHHRHQKPLKPLSLFSCAFFRHCSLSSPLSPTTPTPPPAPPPPPPQAPPPPPPPAPLPPLVPATTHHPDSGSSSSSTSQSFTQWRFTPTFPQPRQEAAALEEAHDLGEVFREAALKFSTGSDLDRLAAVHMLERALVPNPPADNAVVPAGVMEGVVRGVRGKVAEAKSATKVLLAMCLGEGNRRLAVERGAVAGVVEAVGEMEGAEAERALAALELMCTVAEGAAEVRGHVLAVPVLVAAMGRMEGRGREYAISVLAVIYASGGGTEEEMEAVPPSEEVAKAVALAMQGDCSARGRRKAAQLFKALQENGQLDLTQLGR